MVWPLSSCHIVLLLPLTTTELNVVVCCVKLTAVPLSVIYNTTLLSLCREICLHTVMLPIMTTELNVTYCVRRTAVPLSSCRSVLLPIMTIEMNVVCWVCKTDCSAVVCHIQYNTTLLPLCRKNCFHTVMLPIMTTELNVTYCVKLTAVPLSSFHIVLLPIMTIELNVVCWVCKTDCSAVICHSLCEGRKIASSKQTPQVACVSEDLKYWGAWDYTCGHSTISFLSLLEERSAERGSAGRSYLKDEKVPSSAKRIIIGTVSKVIITSRKLLRES